MRIIQRTFLDEPRHRIQIRRGDFAAQPHRLQRNRPAARKGIEHLRSIAPVELFDGCAQLIHRWRVLITPRQHTALHNFLFLVHCVAVIVLTCHQFFHHRPTNEIEQFLPLLGIARIGQQRAEQRSPAGRQRTPRRPDMQRGDVPMPHIFLMHAGQRRLLQRKSDFN